jgi:hypothetical protein
VGNTIRAPFNPNWPLEILNIWTLADHDGKTTLTMWGEPINATEDELKTYESMRHMDLLITSTPPQGYIPHAPMPYQQIHGMHPMPYDLTHPVSLFPPTHIHMRK